MLEFCVFGAVLEFCVFGAVSALPAPFAPFSPLYRLYPPCSKPPKPPASPLSNADFSKKLKLELGSVTLSPILRGVPPSNSMPANFPAVLSAVLPKPKGRVATSPGPPIAPTKLPASSLKVFKSCFCLLLSISFRYSTAFL